MDCHIFDIDGTVFKYHTNEWIDGAKEYIIKLSKQGSNIIFITMRGEHDNGKEWSIDRTKQTLVKELNKLGIKFEIIFGVKSPRIIHDDNHCYFDSRKTNQKWN